MHAKYQSLGVTSFYDQEDINTKHKLHIKYCSKEAVSDSHVSRGDWLRSSTFCQDDYKEEEVEDAVGLWEICF